MTSTDLITAAIKLVLMFGPFALVFSVVSLSDKLIDLLKSAVGVKRDY